MAKDSLKFIQSRVQEKVFIKLKKLADASNRSIANYIRNLVEAHVEAISPAVAKAVSRNLEKQNRDDDHGRGSRP